MSARDSSNALRWPHALLAVTLLVGLVPGVRAAVSPGKDGPITVSVTGTVLNKYATLNADAAAGATSFAVTNPGAPNGLDPATLTPDDLLLIMQMQGATIDATYQVNDFSGGNDEEGIAVAIQPSDGKVVVVGYTDVGGGNQDVTVVRYNFDGTLDTGFGTGGRVTTAIGAGNEQGIDVAIQDDGMIVVVGFTDVGGGDNAFCILRYDSSGTLDPGFGTSGITVTNFNANDDQARGVAIQPADDYIVVAGWSHDGTDYDFALARYNTAGVLDAAGFGSGGTLTTDFPAGLDDKAFSVVIQPLDGFILAGGDSHNGTDWDFAVARYDTTGTLDPLFDTDGRVTTDFNLNGNNHLREVVLRPDGRIYTVGSSDDGGDFDFAAVGYLANGGLDVSFDGDGITSDPVTPGQNDLGQGAVLRPDGTLVVGGFTFNGSDWDFGLLSYHDDGTFDTTFQVDGVVVQPVGNENGFANDIALHSDGRIVLAGVSDNSLDNDITLVGFLPNGVASWGTVLDLGGAGRYELVTVASVAGNTITIDCATGLVNDYTTAGHTQILRVPQYSTLTVDPGGSIVAPAWNGSYGGVIALHVQTTATINGGINAGRRGFRGGQTELNSGGWGIDFPDLMTQWSDLGAEKGEGIAGDQATYDTLGGRYGRGAPANGGGGGSAHNAAGGGGANAHSGGAWTGQGVMDGTVIGGVGAWPLDPEYVNNGNLLTTSPGGGRGGYSFSDSDQDATALAPGSAAWAGDERMERGGLGGHPLVNDPASRLYMGGGGGAGDGNGGAAGAGGRGGGIAILIADSVSGVGLINAEGEPGFSTSGVHDDAAGGGGGGGAVVVWANSITGISIDAKGAVGGNQGAVAGVEAEGPGGGGGGGFIAISSGGITTNAAGGAGGTTASAALTEFPTNGATQGGAGQADERIGGTLPGACFQLTCSPMVNYRSLAQVGGVLFNTGTATVAISSTTVTFDTALPTTIGLGDELIFNTPEAGGNFVLSRDSDFQVTLQSPTTAAHAEGFTLQRAYSGATALTDWEAARDGNLVSENRREVGVGYDPANPFTQGVTFNNSTTDACRYMHLTVAAGHRHNGTAGTGVVLNGAGTNQRVLVQDPFTRIDWWEFDDISGADSIAAIQVQEAHTLIENVLIYDFLEAGANRVSGIRLSGNGNHDITVRNSIIYNGDAYGIEGDDPTDTALIENCTIYGMQEGSGIGGGPSAFTVRNTISMGNSTSDFALPIGAVEEYNLSSDGTASGTGSLTGKLAANQFVTVGSDFHLKDAAADAVDAGTDLSASFCCDIDVGVRPGGAAWDIGADEFAAASAVELLSLAATGVDGGVVVEWETASELNNLGFHIYRATGGDGPWQQVTESLVPGLGSSPEGARYSYRDLGLINGVTYYYRLEDVESSGRRRFHGPVSATPLAGAGEPGDGEADGPEAAEEAPTARIAYGDPGANALRVVRRTAGGVVLELQTEGFYALPQPDGSVRLEVPGFDLHGEPGDPAVPVRHAWVEAMAGRQVSLGRVRAQRVEGFAGLRPEAAGLPQLESYADGTIRAGTRRARRAYRQSDALHPAEAARLLEVGFQGDEKKALVEMAPLRWDAASGQLLLARTLEVSLSFGGREPGERVLGGSRGRRPRGGDTSSERPVVARLLTGAPGLYAVGFEELFPGERRGVRASELRLSRQGAATPFHIEPVGSRFGPGSVLYFVSVGQAANLWGSEAVYELERSGTPGVQMALADAAPWGPDRDAVWARGEWEGVRYYQAALLEAPDLWLWGRAFGGQVWSTDFELQALAATGAPARLELWLQGGSDEAADPDHHVRVRVNGVPVGEIRWDGMRPQRLEAELEGVLLEGVNRLEVENAGDTSASVSVVYVDRFALRYARRPVAAGGILDGQADGSGRIQAQGLGAGAALLETDAAGTPRWLTGAVASTAGLSFRVEAGRDYLATDPAAVRRPGVRLATPSTLRAETNGADYLIVGPRAFVAEAAPLLEQRRRQGLAAVGVAIEDVFDEFGYGEGSPEALRAFLSHAYHHWQGASLRYVVLLGDGNLDTQDLLGTGQGNPVPSPIVKTRYLWTASDPLYAAVNGNDGLPDLALGRLPASSAAEARALVEKILAWEAAGGSLYGPAVLVADNSDGAGDFEGDAERVAQTLVARDRAVERIYVSEQGRGARTSIRAAFDRGASLVSYLGHGALSVWASENIFSRTDVPALQPQAQQPLVLTVNCLNGYFLPPATDSLSEHLVSAQGRGAIAAISPSGLSLHEAASRYHEALIDELVSGGHARLGDAVLAAQIAYANGGGSSELLGLYHLFGDPALEID